MIRRDFSRGGAGPEEENGMGWGGLVPTAAERAADAAHARTQAQMKALRAERDAYKWGYEYLQSRMESLDRHGWAHDCDGEIEARIAAAGAAS